MVNSPKDLHQYMAHSFATPNCLIGEVQLIWPFHLRISPSIKYSSTTTAIAIRDSANPIATSAFILKLASLKLPNAWHELMQRSPPSWLKHQSADFENEEIDCSSTDRLTLLPLKQLANVGRKMVVRSINVIKQSSQVKSSQVLITAICVGTSVTVSDSLHSM